MPKQIDLDSDDRNMFGLLPCPKCKEHYRFPMTKNGKEIIRCDDCGFEEDVVEDA